MSSIVLRPLQSNGINLLRGEIVDTKAWKHASKLQTLRYIKDYHSEQVTCDVCGRCFANKETLTYHNKLEGHSISNEPENSSKNGAELCADENAPEEEADDNDMDLQRRSCEQRKRRG
jgi:hypothetical protein